jgi:tRNA-intron endonuclease
MEEEKTKIIPEIMDGKFITTNGDQMAVRVEYLDETRKFFEKSYYGNLYNSKMQPIFDIFENYSFDGSSDVDLIQLEENLPSDRKPFYIVFELIEALYLIERQKLHVYMEGEKQLGFNELIEIAMENDQKIWQKYIVYRDIRQRGYIVRIGYGGSADFRVFARGAKFARDSAKFVYFIVQDGIPVALNELENVVNQVLGDRKKLILAIFDKLGDSTFYQLQRFKFKEISSFKDKWKQDTILTIKKKEKQ